MLYSVEFTGLVKRLALYNVPQRQEPNCLFSAEQFNVLLKP